MIAESTLAKVCGQFGLHEVEPDRVRPLTARIRPDSFQIRADGRDWVLKRHTAGAELARLPAAHRLELHLHAVGFPVAALWRSPTGMTLLEENGVHYSLHEWITGRRFAVADRVRLNRQDPKFLGRLGSTLGSLHTASTAAGLRNADLPVTAVPTLLTGPAEIAHRIRRPRRRIPPLSLWQQLRTQRVKNDFDEWIIGVFSDITRAADDLPLSPAAQRLQQSEIIPIHNDINWENLLFDNDLDLVALLDFDNLCRSPRLVEVGAAAVVLAGSDHDALQQFISAYEETTRLSADREALVLAMRAKCLRSILVSISTYLRGDLTETTLLQSWCQHLHASFLELG